MTLRRTLILLSLAVALPVTPAAAQSGVVIDDDSPTGKEYAIPLEAARRDAAGQTSGGTPGSASTAPLFGEGVGDSGKDAKGGSRPKASGGASQQSSHTESATVQAGRTAAATVPEGGIGSTLTIVAVALSVLLLGGVIGSIARRRTTTPA